MSVKFNFDNLFDGLENFEVKFDKAMNMYCDTSCKKLEGYAKEHRPWTDRTSQARQRLISSYTTLKNGYRLQLAHGVDYGKFLEATNNPNWKNQKSPDGKNQLTGLQAEFAYERKFAIISPTIRQKSPEILKGLKNLFDRM